MSEGGLPATIKKTAADVSRLARLQAELAKERFQTQAKKKGIFAGMGVGGILFLVYSLLFLLAGAAAGLAIVLPAWLAILIVGGGLLLFGAILLGVSAVGLKGSRDKATAPGEGADEEVPWLRAKTT